MSNGLIARFFLLATISFVLVLSTIFAQSERVTELNAVKQKTVQLPTHLGDAVPDAGVPSTEESPAAAALDEASELAPEIADLNNAAIRLTRESRYDEATELLLRAIAEAPNRFRLHRNLSIVYEHMKRMDEALASAQTAVDIAPVEPTALTQLCGLELINGRGAEAVACYEKLRQTGPMDAMSQTFYGVALLRSGHHDRAVTVLEQAVAAVPANSSALNALGVAYFNKRRYTDAAASFKEAVESDPEQREIRFNLALTYVVLRNKEGAISQYRMLKGERPELAGQLYRILFRDKVVSVDQLKGH